MVESILKAILDEKYSEVQKIARQTIKTTILDPTFYDLCLNTEYFVQS